MRRILMFNRVSADGYFAAPDGNLNWVVPDEEIDAAGAASSPEVDTILFGRRTYDMFESFWPHALDNPSASDPHRPGRKSPSMQAMATFINEAQKLVFSKTRKDVAWKNSKILSEFDPREIQALKNQPGKNMIIFGSGSIVSRLTEHGLIDDYRFVLAPTLLGSGRQLIREVSKSTRLELVEAKPYRSGNVMLHYKRAT